jgi:PAS domain S-box-containing protein
MSDSTVSVDSQATPVSIRNTKSDQTDSTKNVSGSQADILTNLLTRIPDSIICLDRDWRLTFANAEARRVSRLTEADINSKTHWELYPESVGTDLELLYRRVMLTGTPGHIEYFHAPFNLWVDVHVLPTDEGIALYYRDISDRKRAEAQRNAASRHFQQVFDAATDSIVCIDRNWNCTFANHAARNILKTNDLIGANLWIRFPGNQHEPFASNYRTAMDRRIPTEFEAYYAAPLDIWFKVSVRPYEDGIIIFSSDVTSRKKAEARRDATARQLQQVFNTTQDAIVSLSRDWTFTFLNRRAQKLLAIKGDLIGRNLREEFPATNTGNYLYYYNRAMYERIAGEFEDFYPEPLNIWLNIQCIPSDDGIVIFFRDVTAARASKQILLDQQAVLSFVQQTARVATWEIDLSTGNMTFSDGSYPVFGRPCSEITSIEDFRKNVQPEHRSLVQAATRNALSTGEIATVDYQIITSEGETRWVEGRGVPVFNEDGDATHLRGMTTDITSRKRNEVALAASEERYRVLADLNPQAIWMGSPQGQITYANQGFLDYIGLTIEQASNGTGWLEAFYPEDHTRVIDAWTHSVNTGEEYEIEARMIRARDRSVRWWWLRALPVRDEAGKILNWLGIAMDIHDRRTYAETLRAEQEETERQRAELETIYQTAPVGLALFDPVEFRYLRVNDRQAETLGLPKDQIIGRPITEVAPIKGLLDLFRHVAAGNIVRSQLLEGELPTRPGEHRYWNVSYSPVYNAVGDVEAIAAVVQEITNQKKAENALIQSEKLAAVGRLASSISHEINNPLEAITNLLYLVAVDEGLPDTIKPYVTMAQSELSRVCQIATQTLRFHRQAVRATHVTAHELVSAVLNLYQGRLSNSGISVDAIYSSTTPILCFENDIRQVLNNLIANAIDAMRQSGGRLLVRAHDTALRTPEQPDGVPGVRITIADTGHGMSPLIQTRLFEPFYTTKDLNGTGLGLWISSGIVARHNGRLTFRSSEHQAHHGTVFALFLPHEVEPQNS